MTSVHENLEELAALAPETVLDDVRNFGGCFQAIQR
jgi:hypothetical protein